MSLRRLKDVENANLEDILYSCLKGISCSGKTFLKEFLDILTIWFSRHLESIFAIYLLDALKMSDMQI